jgi:hypothetical protein
MQPQLSQPIRVYLSAQPGGAKLRLFPEVVEASSTLANIQELLTQRQLTCADFPPLCGQSLISMSAHSSGRSSSAGGAHAAAQATGSSRRGAAVGSTNVVVKRQDGSCCSRVHVDEGCTIEGLLEAIWEVEVRRSATCSCQTLGACVLCMYSAFKMALGRLDDWFSASRQCVLGWLCGSAAVHACQARGQHCICALICA